MKYIKYFLFLLIVFHLSSCKDKMDISESQANGFIKYFGGGGEDIGNEVKQTADGGYALVGTITSQDLAKQVVFIKTDEYGNIVWKRFFGGSGNDFGNSFIIDSEGNYVIVGTTTLENDTTDVFLIKISDQGTILWENNYGGDYNQVGNSIVETENNDLYVVGNTESKTISNIMLMLVVNNDGDSLNSNTRDYASANSIHLINSYLFIISGIANNKLALFVTVSGTNIPNTNLNYLENSSKAFEVCSTADGNVIVVGTSGIDDNSDIFLAKVTIDLDVIWLSNSSFNGNLKDEGNSVKVTENNDIIIFGTTVSKGEGGNDMYLIKTDSEGNEIFTKTFGGTGDESGSKIALTSDGGFIMIGSSDYEGNSMICLIKTDSEGNIGE